MRNVKKLLVMVLCLTMISTYLVGCSSSGSKQGSGGKTTITYAIWDKNQEPGMKAMADQFMKENPNIIVKVEVTSWEQYWTKLEAAAKGGSLPDVFWMHSNNFLKYAKGNMLMDLTEKIANSSLVKNSDFPEGLVKLYTLNGKQYAIPKDYDTIGLWYNKKLFDAKGIKYPDETWDWNKLREVAKQLTDTKAGVWGFLSPVDTQEITYDLMYQNGGYPISDDRTKSGYDMPESIAAIKFAVDLSLVDKVSPKQTQFTNTSAAQYFESGKAAMGYFGSWMTSEFFANDYTKKNCDVTVLPKGVKRASIYNGLGNAISAKTKHPNEAWKFDEYLGTEEANKIQSQYGSAIPAYKNMTEGWIEHFKGFNVKAYPDMLSYAVLFPNNWEGMSTFFQQETDGLNAIYGEKTTVEQGAKDLAAKMNADIEATK
ncbi:MAG: sugar ABC transporter substrate-binding protein [Clostridiales bacterium]|nr:sugar ABC transporter substrate-binding protein [Clostridiales bacterium]